MQIASAALSQVRGRWPLENIYYKSETTLPFKADLGQENGFIKGGKFRIIIAQEYGLKISM